MLSPSCVGTVKGRTLDRDRSEAYFRTIRHKNPLLIERCDVRRVLFGRKHAKNSVAAEMTDSEDDNARPVPPRAIDHGVNLNLGRDGLLEFAREQLEAGSRDFLSTGEGYKVPEWGEATGATGRNYYRATQATMHRQEMNAEQRTTHEAQRREADSFMAQQRRMYDVMTTIEGGRIRRRPRVVTDEAMVEEMDARCRADDERQAERTAEIAAQSTPTDEGSGEPSEFVHDLMTGLQIDPALNRNLFGGSEGTTESSDSDDENELRTPPRPPRVPIEVMLTHDMQCPYTHCICCTAGRHTSCIQSC